MVKKWKGEMNCVKKSYMALMLIIALCVSTVMPVSAADPIEISPFLPSDEDAVKAYLEEYLDCEISGMYKVDDVDDLDLYTSYTYYDTECGDITVIFSNGDGRYMEFSSTSPICGVFLVDGDGGDYNRLYIYKPCVSEDEGLLIGPFGQSPNDRDISHVWFYCCECEPPVPSPEFPTLAVPVGLLIGMVYVVSVVRGRKEE